MDKLNTLMALYVANYAQVNAIRTPESRAAYSVASRLYSEFLDQEVWPSGEFADYKKQCKHVSYLQRKVEEVWL